MATATYFTVLCVLFAATDIGKSNSILVSVRILVYLVSLLGSPT